MDPSPILFSLSGISGFLLYFFTALILLLLFKTLYPLITPHKEWQLVKQQKNSAAAIAFAGAIIGFSIALGSAASQSVAYLDFLIWGLIALFAQVLAFYIVKLMMPQISERLKNEELSAGIMAGGTAIAVGILNAASMTY